MKALPRLQEFYEATTKHRKLSWIYSLGNCQLTGKFQTRTVDIIVQGLQASVLLLFNDGELLGKSDIQVLASAAKTVFL